MDNLGIAAKPADFQSADALITAQLTKATNSDSNGNQVSSVSHDLGRGWRYCDSTLREGFLAVRLGLHTRAKENSTTKAREGVAKRTCQAIGKKRKWMCLRALQLQVKVSRKYSTVSNFAVTGRNRVEGGMKQGGSRTCSTLSF